MLNLSACNKPRSTGLLSDYVHLFGPNHSADLSYLYDGREVNLEKLLLLIDCSCSATLLCNTGDITFYTFDGPGTRQLFIENLEIVNLALLIEASTPLQILLSNVKVSGSMIAFVTIDRANSSVDVQIETSSFVDLTVSNAIMVCVFITRDLFMSSHTVDSSGGRPDQH